MSKRFDICIVIPCYNESKNFLVNDYNNFIINHSNTLLCFVNDGSSDETLIILKNFKAKYPHNVEIISYANNCGKAEAVRKGILYCGDKFEYKFIAYVDADLAVSLDECHSLTQYFKKDIIFCFGSRINRIGSVIDRKKSRFIIGRLIATIISQILSLKVYDTQCGCKLFTKNLSIEIFTNPFLSKWLFDVELFFRIINKYGKDESLTKMIEIPLLKWTERGDSKVKTTYFFKLWFDLIKIRKKYKNAGN